MSELKAYKFLGRDEIYPDANLGNFYYLKSEADKVIAHNKYKRCLAMADNCEKEAMVVCYNEPRIEWLGKWKLRWLELAEKFKEAK